MEVIVGMVITAACFVCLTWGVQAWHRKQFDELVRRLRLQEVQNGEQQKRLEQIVVVLTAAEPEKFEALLGLAERLKQLPPKSAVTEIESAKDRVKRLLRHASGNQTAKVMLVRNVEWVMTASEFAEIVNQFKADHHVELWSEFRMRERQWKADDEAARQRASLAPLFRDGSNP